MRGFAARLRPRIGDRARAMPMYARTKRYAVFLLGDFERGWETIREPLDNGGDARLQASLSAAAMARR